jgi:hypothetical protein
MSKLEISESEKIRLYQLQNSYYSNNFILFLISNELKNRELSLLANKRESKPIHIRYLYASSPNYLKMHLESFVTKGETKLVNLYRSVAKFQEKSIPVSTYKLVERKDDPRYVKFNENIMDYIEGFDMVLDLDGVSIEEVYSIAKIVKDKFDSMKLPYYIKPSGMRGWHIIIPSEYLPNLKIEDLILSVRDTMKNFMFIYKLDKYFDDSVTNPKSLIKCSYSIDGDNISIPLDDKQFNEYEPKIIKCDYVLKNYNLFNRGLLIRKHNLNEEQLKQNVKEFISNFSYSIKSKRN